MPPSAKTRSQLRPRISPGPRVLLRDNFSSSSSNLVRVVPHRKIILAAILLLGLLLPVCAQSEDQTPEDVASNDNAEKFKWKTAFAQSGILLGVQHAGRMVQSKTRRELAGPFWSDYFEEASSIHTWNDG